MKHTTMKKFRQIARFEQLASLHAQKNKERTSRVRYKMKWLCHTSTMTQISVLSEDEGVTNRLSIQELE